MIKFPEKLLCQNCKNGINLNYDGNIASTSDILSLEVEIPHSEYSGKDARKNKQDIGKYGQLIFLCQHCNAILGIVPGINYLWKYAQ